jgi:hypothetical protein
MRAPDEPQVPGEPAQRAPLSLNQEFLCAFDKGDAEGAFSHRHTLVYGWRLRGAVDVDSLRGALADVVARHEVLRTTLVHGPGDQYQEIHPPGDVRLLVRELSGRDPRTRDLAAEEFLNELDASTFSVHELPHLRAELGLFDDNDAVLVLTAHHTATDPWSLGLIIRDLAAYYAARRGSDPENPPGEEGLRGDQYRGYALWQQTGEATAAADVAREYWRRKLDGAQILGIATDRTQPAGVTNAYSVYRFLVDAELTSATLAFAKSARSSAFMVLLAAYNLVLHEMTGATDVVVPTFTSGRYQDRFMNVVGPFYNFVPLRTDLTGCETFRDVLHRTRTTCIEAYSHDIPFIQIVAEAPELTRPFAEQGLAVAAFELLQSPAAMDGEQVGDLTYTELRHRVLSQQVSSDIPDGVLWAIDVLPTGEMSASVKFNRNVFDRATLERIVSDFCRVLEQGVTAPDVALLKN